MDHTLAVVATLLCIVVVVTLVIKKYSSVFIFLVSGMMILLLSVIFGGGSIIGGKTAGNAVTDVLAYTANVFKPNASGVGLTLMMVTRYAVYTPHIGVSTRLTYPAIKPLSEIKNPYVVLSMLFITETPLKLVVTSHMSLVMLLMTIAFPIFTPLGIGKLSTATVITMCDFMDWGPSDPSTILTAENVVRVSVMNYFLTCQGKAVAIPILICAVLLPTYLRHMDKKDASTGSVAAKTEMPRDSSCPACYVMLPIVLLILITVFSFIPSIKMNAVTINLLELFFVFILELVRRRDRKEVTNDFSVVMKTTGNSFTNVVNILIGTAVLAEAIKLLGGITIMSDVSASAESASTITITLMSMITLLTDMFLGSGNASWYAFGPLVPDVTAQIGVSTATITLPMQLSSGIGRCMSPVAGVIIAILSMTELGIMDVIRRCSVPAIVMLVRNMIVSYIIV